MKTIISNIYLRISFLFLIASIVSISPFQAQKAHAAFPLIPIAIGAAATWFLSDEIGDTVLGAVKALLYGIMVFFGWFATVGVGIFSYAIDPKHIVGDGTTVGLLNNDAIRHGWAFVRDFFNIFFILVLLFSAFATIFQVEKFHLKRTLLMIVLMALLVNFSWPIARIIMDMGNVTMYFLADNMFSSISGSASGASIMAVFGGQSNMGDILVSNYADTYSIMYLLAGITFTFLFAITIMAMALIMLIRIVILALLLVFAPIGFVLLILPSTSRYAHDWWNSLFKWTFIGPIQIFMIGLSIKLMTEIGYANSTAIKSALKNDLGGKGGGGSFATEAALFIIPIVLLWSALIIGQKMGGSAAGMVVSRAGAAAKWGGRMARKGAWGATKATGRTLDAAATGGSASASVRNVGQRWNNWRTQRNDAYAETVGAAKARGLQRGGPGGDPNAVARHNSEMQAKHYSQIKKDDISTALAVQMQKDETDPNKKAALARYMTEKKDFADVVKNDKNNGQTEQNNYDELMSSIDSLDDSIKDSVRANVEGKMNEKNAVMVLKEKANKAGGNPTPIYKDRISKMSPEQFQKQSIEFHQDPQVRIQMRQLDDKQLTKIAEKLPEGQRAVWRSDKDAFGNPSKLSDAVG